MPASSSAHGTQPNTTGPAIWDLPSAPGPADLFSTPDGSFGPLTGDWLLYGGADLNVDALQADYGGIGDWSSVSAGTSSVFAFGDALNNAHDETANCKYCPCMRTCLYIYIYT